MKYLNKFDPIKGIETSAVYVSICVVCLWYLNKFDPIKGIETNRKERVY